jgi:hypothetical protein
MDPSGRPRPIPDGATCTACGAPVPTGRIRLLAVRDDLAFVELGCDGCGSAALGLVLDADGPAGRPILDVAADGPGPITPASHGRRARPIDETDVAALQVALGAWQGDLVGWLDSLERPAHGSAPDR